MILGHRSPDFHKEKSKKEILISKEKRGELLSFLPSLPAVQLQLLDCRLFLRPKLM